MTRWFVLEHPSKSLRFVPEGPSWGFFFLGSLWAMLQGNWGLLGWWLLCFVPFVGLGALDPPDALKFAAFAAGLLLRWWFTVWFWEKKKIDLLDKGWREVSVLEGPTRDFVEAEWFRRTRPGRARPGA